MSNICVYFHSVTSVVFFRLKGPLQKLTNRNEYNKVVDGLMYTKGISRAEAEKEYDAFLQNPNDYALNKVRQFIYW